MIRRSYLNLYDIIKMPPKVGPKEKALSKQQLLEEEKEKKALIEKEKAEAASWEVGAKNNAKGKLDAEKEEEKRRRELEKAQLLAAEEAELGNITRTVKTKKKGKDDFDLLDKALKDMPKSKAQKDADLKKKAEEERKKKEDTARIAKEEKRKAEEEYIRKNAAKGIIINHTDDLFVPINNRLPDEDDDEDGYYEDLSGLDAANNALGSTVFGKMSIKDEQHPERRQKALYNAYYEAQLPIMKLEQPGLKLTQYKERIFEAWKKSPENPINQKKL